MDPKSQKGAEVLFPARVSFVHQFYLMTSFRRKSDNDFCFRREFCKLVCAREKKGRKGRKDPQIGRKEAVSRFF